MEQGNLELYLKSRRFDVGPSFLFEDKEYLITKRTQEGNETRTTFIIKERPENVSTRSSGCV